jgi:hypothetical protein
LAAGRAFGLQITPRDRQLLHWLSCMRLATAAQIGRCLGTSAEAAALRARSLCRVGLMRRRRVLWDLPSLYWTLPTGARLAGSPVPAPGDIDLGTLRHDLALVSLSLDLLAAVPGSHWISERELRHAEAGEEGLGLRRHIPDGVHVQPDGQRVAVELELTAKTARRLTAILRFYARSRAYDAVRYFLPGTAAAARLERLAHELPHVRAEVWAVPAEAGGEGAGEHDTEAR